jgi:exopolysaccharide production protein ExoQ
MPPSLALFLWFALLLALLWFDPAREPKGSAALWLPVIWMSILGSRLPSQWLGGQGGVSAEAFSEGSPFDRIVYFAIIFLAIGVLAQRPFHWGKFVGRNSTLFALLLLELLSATWSEFPFIAFKRWFRDLGGYLVILVIVSDPRPLEAVRTVLRRLCYFLISLSVVLVKYLPEVARRYDYWTGTAEYVGVTTSKNMLGLLCLLSGLYFFWDTATRWPERKQRRIKRVIAVDVAFLAMTVWLLKLSNSATSRVCFVLGCLVIVATHVEFFKRRPAFLKVMIPAAFGFYAVLAFSFDMLGKFAGAVGRNATLTDRSKIWDVVRAQQTNPLLGTGYQSFWLGSRLESIWANGVGHINETHNGYLDIYLNLGIVGLVFVGAFLIAGYRNIWRKISVLSPLGSFSLAIWAILLFYNVTEAAFAGGLLWLALLPGALGAPNHAEQRIVSRSRRPYGTRSYPISQEIMNERR